jgi:hypothetical protein
MRTRLTSVSRASPKVRKVVPSTPPSVSAMLRGKPKRTRAWMMEDDHPALTVNSTQPFEEEEEPAAENSGRRLSVFGAAPVSGDPFLLQKRYRSIPLEEISSVVESCPEAASQCGFAPIPQGVVQTTRFRGVAIFVSSACDISFVCRPFARTRCPWSTSCNGNAVRCHTRRTRPVYRQPFRACPACRGRDQGKRLSAACC